MTTIQLPTTFFDIHGSPYRFKTADVHVSDTYPYYVNFSAVSTSAKVIVAPVEIPSDGRLGVQISPTQWVVASDPTEIVEVAVDYLER